MQISFERKLKEPIDRAIVLFSEWGYETKERLAVDKLVLYDLRPRREIDQRGSNEKNIRKSTDWWMKSAGWRMINSIYNESIRLILKH